MVSAEGADLASLVISQKNTVFFRLNGDLKKIPKMNQQALMARQLST